MSYIRISEVHGFNRNFQIPDIFFVFSTRLLLLSLILLQPSKLRTRFGHLNLLIRDLNIDILKDANCAIEYLIILSEYGSELQILNGIPCLDPAVKKFFITLNKDKSVRNINFVRFI